MDRVDIVKNLKSSIWFINPQPPLHQQSILSINGITKIMHDPTSLIYVEIVLLSPILAPLYHAIIFAF